MNDYRHSDLKNKLSKWLFAAALLLSLFTFPGFAYQSQARYESPKTTLVVNTETTFAKSIGYNRASAQNKLACFSFQSLSTLELGRIHTRQLKTRISIISCNRAISQQITFFYQVKTIPQNAGDDPAILLG